QNKDDTFWCSRLCSQIPASPYAEKTYPFHNPNPASNSVHAPQFPLPERFVFPPDQNCAAGPPEFHQKPARLICFPTKGSVFPGLLLSQSRSPDFSPRISKTF